MTADVDQELARWWSELTQVALFGTDRREPPPTPAPLPSRSGAEPEIAVLDAAALGSALLRAGAEPPPQTESQIAPADDDQRLAAQPRARQLLELIMTQSPAGARLQTRLLWHWLQSAADAGRRIPHRWLLDVLDRLHREPAITGDPDRLNLIRTVADERGRWLSELDPAWRWLQQDLSPPTDPGQWARRPTATRAAALRRLRPEDPAAARLLISSALPTDGAQDRATLLGCLQTNLGPADESLLEQGLDDRSGIVRATAAELLDGLDGSARAGRMADRLRTLLSVHGLINKKLSIELPHAPDADGLRDGLGKPPTRRSERGYWLERIAAGAPLSVWTDATGREPAPTWAMINDEDARSGIITAILARHDQQWAGALSADREGMRARPEAFLQLMHLLPADAWEQRAIDWLSDLNTPTLIGRVIRGVPTPWGSRLSLTAVNALDRVNLPIGDLIEPLARALHPSALDRLSELATGQGSVATREGARNLTQYLTLKIEIAEAFR